MPAPAPQAGIPLWLKIGFSCWVLLWALSYWHLYGPFNYFWLCNIANFLILLGLWRESRLLLSAQCLAVLLIGMVWTLDVAVAFVTGGVDGWHLIGGTEYMFDPEIPLAGRLLSLYHSFLPLVALYGVYRVGYDRRGIHVQTLITAVLLIVTWLVVDPELNINWVHAPFGAEEQELLPPPLYLVAVIVATPVLLYLPSHFLIRGLLAALGNRQRDQ